MAQLQMILQLMQGGLFGGIQLPEQMTSPKPSVTQPIQPSETPSLQPSESPTKEHGDFETDSETGQDMDAMIAMLHQLLGILQGGGG